MMTAKQYQKRLKPKRKDDEHQIQSEYFKILSENEAEFPMLKYIFAIPNGGKRHIKVAMKMKREGVKRGVPDIFIPITIFKYDGGQNPQTGSGKFLETKTNEGVLSKEQKEYRYFLFEQGYNYCICRSVEELIIETENYLNIKLKT